MKKITLLLLVLVPTLNAFAQNRFSTNELSINGFRNPSIGLEYRYHRISVHAGYYITALERRSTHKFVKTGATAWFLAIGKRENPSSFYAGASYLRGLNLDYKDENAFGLELGFRWMIWKGLQVRVGGMALASTGHRLHINPTSGVSYSFFF